MIYSWCSVFSTKKEFAALMELVEKGVLEELFIAEVSASEIAGYEMKEAKLISFAFSKEKNLLNTLEKICLSFSLDEVSDEFFERNGDEYILKGVNYPTSEKQEEMIINKLL